MQDQSKTNGNEVVEIQKTEDQQIPIIAVKDVIKIYKQGDIEVAALRGLNSSFYTGEISVIMGPSGCGKTTLLNAIGGLNKISSGEIQIWGKKINSFSEKQLDEYRLKQLGYIFQFFNLIPEFTARENIAFPLELNKTDKDEIKQRVDKLLDLVNLKERESHYPHELSGGEQQRIAIAAALANDPQILLCDEPTGELDTKSKQEVMKIFTEIIARNPDKCIIIVSHDPELRYIANRVFQIRDGIISHIIENTEVDKVHLEDLLENGSNSGKKNDELLYELQETIFYLQGKLNKVKKG